MNDARDAELVAAARVALAAAWCAAVSFVDVFRSPRFKLSADDVDSDAESAARQLASLRLPVRIVPGHWDGDSLSLNLTSKDDGRTNVMTSLAAGTTDNQAILIVGGGRALLVDGRILKRSATSFAVYAPTSVAGGPTEDFWTQGLALPDSWLADSPYVYLLGRSERNQSFQPVRMATGFDARLIDDLRS